MCGIATYQEVIPPYVHESEEPSPGWCFLHCTHGDACRHQWERFNRPVDEDFDWEEVLASYLGCEDCGLFDD